MIMAAYAEPTALRTASRSQYDLPLATTRADGCLPGVSARFLHDDHGLCVESNGMPGAVLKQQKGLSRDLVGGDFAKWHIRKAVP